MFVLELARVDVVTRGFLTIGPIVAGGMANVHTFPRLSFAAGLLKLFFLPVGDL